jgi:hypothetical protein
MRCACLASLNFLHTSQTWDADATFCVSFSNANGRFQICTTYMLAHAFLVYFAFITPTYICMLLLHAILFSFLHQVYYCFNNQIDLHSNLKELIMLIVIWRMLSNASNIHVATFIASYPPAQSTNHQKLTTWTRMLTLSERKITLRKQPNPHFCCFAVGSTIYTTNVLKHFTSNSSKKSHQILRPVHHFVRLVCIITSFSLLTAKFQQQTPHLWNCSWKSL